MEKRNTLLLTIVAVSTLLVAVVGATFAYFASTITPGEGMELDVTAQASTAQFTAGGTEFSMIITPDLMQESQSAENPIAKTANGTLTVQLKADNAATCTYDIKFEWTNESSYTPTTGLYAEDGAALVNNGKEFTVMAALQENANATAGTNTLAEETNLDKVVTTVVDNATINVDGTEVKQAEAIWSFTSNFYNLSLNQSPLSGAPDATSKAYTARFYVDNVVC